MLQLGFLTQLYEKWPVLHAMEIQCGQTCHYDRRSTICAAVLSSLILAISIRRKASVFFKTLGLEVFKCQLGRRCPVSRPLLVGGFFILELKTYRKLAKTVVRLICEERKVGRNYVHVDHLCIEKRFSRFGGCLQEFLYFERKLWEVFIVQICCTENIVSTLKNLNFFWPHRSIVHCEMIQRNNLLRDQHTSKTQLLLFAVTLGRNRRPLNWMMYGAHTSIFKTICCGCERRTVFTTSCQLSG